MVCLWDWICLFVYKSNICLSIKSFVSSCVSIWMRFVWFFFFLASNYKKLKQKIYRVFFKVVLTAQFFLFSWKVLCLFIAHTHWSSQSWYNGIGNSYREFRFFFQKLCYKKAATKNQHYKLQIHTFAITEFSEAFVQKIWKQKKNKQKKRKWQMLAENEMLS